MRLTTEEKDQIVELVLEGSPKEDIAQRMGLTVRQLDQAKATAWFKTRVQKAENPPWPKSHRPQPPENDGGGRFLDWETERLSRIQKMREKQSRMIKTLDHLTDILQRPNELEPGEFATYVGSYAKLSDTLRKELCLDKEDKIEIAKAGVTEHKRFTPDEISKMSLDVVMAFHNHGQVTVTDDD